MSTFTGFSEEDLKRIKSGETKPNNEPILLGDPTNLVKPVKFASLSSNKNRQFQLKNFTVRKQGSDESLDEMQFDKCRLSIRTTNTEKNIINNNESLSHGDQNDNITVIEPINDDKGHESDNSDKKDMEFVFSSNIIRKDSSDVGPDLVRGVDMTEDELASHRMKLEELQLKQKLMEEQNKKRKEMLSKALADRTRQTEEEVLKLEKIKKELQVLDGQFSQDINVLRKKIDQACLTYAEAEKHYLKVEKEFLQAKIQLQKEKEKKELLTEHLCALITHNETRKAQKLETLMLELASNKKPDTNEVNTPVNEVNTPVNEVTNPVDKVTTPVDEKDEKPIIVDGVDERTGKIVEINSDS